MYNEMAETCQVPNARKTILDSVFGNLDEVR